MLALAVGWLMLIDDQ